MRPWARTKDFIKTLLSQPFQGWWTKQKSGFHHGFLAEQVAPICKVDNSTDSAFSNNSLRLTFRLSRLSSRRREELHKNTFMSSLPSSFLNPTFEKISYPGNHTGIVWWWKNKVFIIDSFLDHSPLKICD